MKKYPEVALARPEILLPRPEIDLSRWAVIACDQHTSEPEYWQEVERFVGDSPSTLNLIFPEVYLKEKDVEARIKRIKEAMHRYLEKDLFIAYEGFIYVERQISTGKRGGLLLCLDLEQYDYNPGARTLIRATEGTILERIPPRVKIREGAPIELPHVLVLIDDPEDRVIGPLRSLVKKNDPGLKKLYDFDLMLNSGHLAGWLIANEQIEAEIISNLKYLANPKVFSARYQIPEENPVLLYAVGDGNHSLATAKTIWESHKLSIKETQLSESPLRYALVEVVNLHDPALFFEPIHRLLFEIKPELNLLEEIKIFFNHEIRPSPCQSLEEIKDQLKNYQKTGQAFGLVVENENFLVEILRPRHSLTVGSVQLFLDEFLKQGKAGHIDYVHGDEILVRFARQPGNAGFYLPTMDKNHLFKTVIIEGILPRKTFSMGEAWEKRFYLEARRLS
ncbi:MAG: DUF1015 domain-containing protein [Candidatus Aminicenantes bacterium]|nr:DUF1015 domain-containing protein [Candidatus Aminicenantes bacterium]